MLSDDKKLNNTLEHCRMVLYGEKYDFNHKFLSVLSIFALLLVTSGLSGIHAPGFNFFYMHVVLIQNSILILFITFFSYRALKRWLYKFKLIGGKYRRNLDRIILATKLADFTDVYTNVTVKKVRKQKHRDLGIYLQKVTIQAGDLEHALFKVPNINKPLKKKAEYAIKANMDYIHVIVSKT